MSIALERGVLFKAGKQVAIYDAGENLVRSPKRLGPMDYAAIAEAIGHRPQFVVDLAGSGGPARVGKSGGGRLVVAAPPDNPAISGATARKVRVRKIGSAVMAPRWDDPEPARDPRLGDKTPVWAEWLRRNDPASYAIRYQVHSKFPRLREPLNSEPLRNELPLETDPEELQDWSPRRKETVRKTKHLV